jgi:hypothetical protein
MGNPVSKAALAFSAAALLAAQPAQAAMGCWNSQQTAAAKVRDLQSRLMVAALRCKAMGFDMLTAYNDFVRRNRDALQTTNGLIRSQFETVYGKDADLYYDRFATGLANRYGGDATTGEICSQVASAAQEAAAASGDMTRLTEIADRFGPAPDLPGGACPEAFVTPLARAAAPRSFAAAMDLALSTVSDTPEGADAPPARADDPRAADPQN